VKTVLYTRSAATALRKHANRAAWIRAKIAQYAEDAASQANNVKSLAGVDAKRLRVGWVPRDLHRDEWHHHHSGDRPARRHLRV